MIKIHKPTSIHKHIVTFLAANSTVAWFCHGNPGVEAFLFFLNGVVAAFAVDLEREWNEHFGH